MKRKTNYRKNCKKIAAELYEDGYRIKHIHKLTAEYGWSEAQSNKICVALEEIIENKEKQK